MSLRFPNWGGFGAGLLFSMERFLLKVIIKWKGKGAMVRTYLGMGGVGNGQRLGYVAATLTNQGMELGMHHTHVPHCPFLSCHMVPSSTRVGPRGEATNAFPGPLRCFPLSCSRWISRSILASSPSSACGPGGPIHCINSIQWGSVPGIHRLHLLRLRSVPLSCSSALPMQEALATFINMEKPLGSLDWSFTIPWSWGLAIYFYLA